MCGGMLIFNGIVVLKVWIVDFILLLIFNFDVVKCGVLFNDVDVKGVLICCYLCFCEMLFGGCSYEVFD